MKLKLLDLFSGIGGFSLGLESTGYFETIAFVEKDKFCQQVLEKNFKDIPIESEVRDVKGDRYAADIVCGGFPCQPFSVAGKRKGTDDDRYLWDETIRIVRECKPRWFIGENVEGIINIQEGMVLRQVCDDLEKEGFEVQCLVIPASGIGAWHQRKRVWILAYSNNNGSYRQKRNETKQSSNEQKDRLSFRDDKDVSNSGSKRSQGFNNQQEPSEQKQRQFTNKDDEDVWNTESTRLQSSSNRQGEREFWGTSTPGEQCQRTWWQIESGICGVPHGLSKTLDKSRANRIKSLGNSIVPLIARELGLAIIKAETDG
jgi:DNA (cytosine-5)-methyltransferase 1